MLEGNAGSATPLGGAPLWLPGKKMEEAGFMAAAPVSSRALEIAKSREELLLLLHDVPESEYELSLTDLVERRSLAPAAGKDQKGSPPVARKEEKKKKKRRTSSGGGSSSDGVLLNLYLPSSLSRSLTTPTNGSRRRPAAAREEDGKKR
ncbi:hypothetical protein ZIOFF_036362 [Zingiber officinale]|uniref:Uncharacterized protein n=2 Tax=Zingiber officinale TaxID=94328 RepID=A0A8J5GIG8_ZINOF|nr:hypothetical protein ZIOFF_036362 [Zingiber officinale]